MKKLLIFVDWYEPGYKAGGPIRSVKNLVDQLKTHAEIYIITSNRDYQDNTPYKGIPPNQWVKRDEHVWVNYLSPDTISKKTLTRLIDEVGAEQMYINSLFSLPFALLPLWLLRKQTDKQIVVAPRGMLAPGALSVKPLKKQLFLRFGKFLFRNVAFHATNETEALQVRKWFGRSAKVFTAPNLPASLSHTQITPALKTKGELRLISVARISPEKNTLQAISMLQKLDPGKEVQISLDLYGPVNDAEYWKKCLQTIEQLPDNISVRHQGSIPNHALPATLVQYHVFYLPTLGENFGHSILEALSAGKPVLISDRTPWNQVNERKAGWAFPLNQPLEFARCINELVAMEQETYSPYAHAAFNLSKENADATELVKKYCAMFTLDRK